MTYFKNWKCYAYHLHNDKIERAYKDLKEYFIIDGSEKCICIKDILCYKKGENYNIWYSNNYGFFIQPKILY